MPEKINAINLTTGLEFLPAIAPDYFTRLQSSHLEGKHWQRFIDSVDANTLYLLATGHHICLHDCGSRRHDGVPLVSYVLARTWGFPLIDRYTLVKTHNCEKLFKVIFHSLDRRNIKYYRKFVDTDQIHLSGCSKLSLLDGKI